MNQPNILELIKDAPVEWKKLGEVTQVLRGRRLTKSQLSTDFKIPVFHGGLEPLGFYNQANRPAESVMVINVGASAGTVGYSTKEFWSSDGCFTLKHSKELNNKFLYYFLIGYEFLLKSRVRMAGIPTLDVLVLENIEVPILPLTIQQEIVRILDAMTAVTSELTSELSAREKQYNYYRDQLLNFDENKVEWKTLGDVGELIRGSGLQKKDFTDSGVGCIHYGQIYTHYGTFAYKTLTYVSTEFASKARKAACGDVIIATTSENDEDVCKAVAWLGSAEIAVSNDACIYKHRLNPKYVSYFFKTEHFQTQKRQYITGTKVRRVNVDNLAKILIPVPSLDEQARIVAILDKFDTLTTSLSEGLPREIELRQKQYEYYRNLLLTFPKPKQEAI